MARTAQRSGFRRPAARRGGETTTRPARVEGAERAMIMTRLKMMTTALAAGALAFAVAPVQAQELPGKGKTVHYAQSDSLGANYVTAQIVMKALKELGYDVKLSTVNTTLFFQAAAQGDLDLAT